MIKTILSTTDGHLAVALGYCITANDYTGDRALGRFTGVYFREKLLTAASYGDSTLLGAKSVYTAVQRLLAEFKSLGLPLQPGFVHGLRAEVLGKWLLQTRESLGYEPDGLTYAAVAWAVAGYDPFNPPAGSVPALGSIPASPVHEPVLPQRAEEP